MTNTFTPNTTPVYTLGEDDYIVQESSVGINLGVTPGGPALRSGATPITGGFTDDPLHILRSTPADANNMIEVECLDRQNNYNTAVTEAFDQGSIDVYGVRRDTSIKARLITDPLYGWHSRPAAVAAPASLPQHLYLQAWLEIHTFCWSRWTWCRSLIRGLARAP